MTWHKEAGSNLLVITKHFRTQCTKCLYFFLCYDNKKGPEKSTFSYDVTLVTKKMFLSQKSCSLSARCLITVARSQCGRKAQAIRVRKKVKEVDRCVRICKCPVGIDLKGAFERVYFCTKMFFHNTMRGIMNIFAGKMTTGHKSRCC